MNIPLPANRMIQYLPPWKLTSWWSFAGGRSVDENHNPTIWVKVALLGWFTFWLTNSDFTSWCCTGYSDGCFEFYSPDFTQEAVIPEALTLTLPSCAECDADMDQRWPTKIPVDRLPEFAQYIHPHSED